MAEKSALLFAAALCLVGTDAVAQRAPWPTAVTNPRPAEGDLILPLPCGGAIALRPVPVPAAPTLLADREITLGQPDADAGYTEFLRRSFIAGAFPGARPGEPARFYLGKYEVTRDQYAAVMAEDSACPPLPSQGGTLPRNEVAWHEAAGFAARLSRHLRRTARERLPEVEDAVSFARLPTEDEWEFAARGGAAVDAADFAARTYPMPEGMNAYEFFQGARSADGRVRPIGGLRPNPLGLHDMLGNVAEWALDSYRLNRIGRPHGLAGGQVSRGGHFRMPEDEIRSSGRIEHPPVSRVDGEISRPATVGFRIVLTRETVASSVATRRLGEEFNSESAARDSQLEADDPARLIELLRRETPDEGIRTGLGRLEARLQSETRERRDQEAVSLRARIESAVYVGRQVALSEGQVRMMTVFISLEIARVERDAEMQRDLGELSQVMQSAVVRNRLGNLAEDVRRRLDPMEQAMGGQLGVSRRTSTVLREILPQTEMQLRVVSAQYVSLLVGIGRGADLQRLEREGAVVIQDLQGRRIGSLPEVARVVVRHLDMVARTGSIDQQVALRDLAAAIASPAPAAQTPRSQAPPAQSPRR